MLDGGGLPSSSGLCSRQSILHLEAGQLFLDGTQDCWVGLLPNLLGTIVFVSLCIQRMFETRG